MLRRVYLDLIGIPPSQAEVAAFVADKSAQAYEKVVDKLLASPQYGERWGRHWLDIWRYSDWYGYRQTEPGALLTAAHLALARLDDRIAQREQAVRSDDRRRCSPATKSLRRIPKVHARHGYLARNWYMFNRNVWLQDTVEYTSAAFPRPDDEMRTLPHAQVRSDSARRLLPDACVLRAA